MHKLATGFLVLCIAAVIGAAGGATYWFVSRSFEETGSGTRVLADEDAADAEEEAGGTAIAFFYQTVGALSNGRGQNAVRAGVSADGVDVRSLDADVLDWAVGDHGNEGFGDPVFSRLSDGTWTMTAWSTPSDPRGAMSLMYHEASCPAVNEDDVQVLGPSDAPGCAKVNATSMGKSSQVFDYEEATYVFHTINGSVYLAKLADATHETADLDSICVLPNDRAAESLDALEFGESTPILGTMETGLLLSDTGIAQREDGTWVLFVKGIAPDNGCEARSLCELCTRSIYRTTSDDLVSWGDLEKVVEGASVPEATTMPDGTVRLYYQDFSDACEAQQIPLASIAPISTVYETEDGYAMSEPERTRYPDEAFETNARVHYATNGNPVSLPDADALEALEACF